MIKSLWAAAIGLGLVIIFHASSDDLFVMIFQTVGWLTLIANGAILVALGGLKASHALLRIIATAPATLALYEKGLHRPNKKQMAGMAFGVLVIFVGSLFDLLAMALLHEPSAFFLRGILEGLGLLLDVNLFDVLRAVGLVLKLIGGFIVLWSLPLLKPGTLRNWYKKLKTSRQNFFQSDKSFWDSEPHDRDDPFSDIRGEK